MKPVEAILQRLRWQYATFPPPMKGSKVWRWKDGQLVTRLLIVHGSYKSNFCAMGIRENKSILAHPRNTIWRLYVLVHECPHVTHFVRPCFGLELLDR